MGVLLMPNAETEILLQVENLPLCRAFYRDALMLGNPEIDSNFLCRFRLADGASLTLEQVVRKTIQNPAWCWEPDEPQLVFENLRAFGYQLKKTTAAQRPVRALPDPESNTVLLME
ncbi:MAG TPA: hypothetical protein DDZ11_03870 [Lentisphaeria bacterium]|nr:hypothetical protein [Lentisphaeria bacterium]